MNRLIMMIGLPGSGKSSYAGYLAKHFPNIVFHSSDSVRKEIHGDEMCQKNTGKVFEIVYRRTIADLKYGRDVIFDATNIKAADRKKTINTIKSACPLIEVIALIMDTEPDVCKARNNARKRVVPDYVYDRMLREYTAPVFEEGFDQILRVNVRQNF